MFHKVAPMLLVDDVDEALSWYQSVLGAHVQYSMPQKPPFEWVSLLLNDVEIMFAQKKSAQTWYSNNVAISGAPTNCIAYIYVDSVDDLYERLKEKATIIMEPTDQWYGIREFGCMDPFGFVLLFAQIIE